MLNNYNQNGGKVQRTLPPGSKGNPAKDFYKYVNDTWLKQVHMPSFVGSYGVSEEIEDKIRDKLMGLITELRRTKPKHELSVISNSFLNSSFQRNSVVDIQRFSNMFECISSLSDVFYNIGAMNRIQSRAPISCVVNSDSNNSLKCVVYLYETQLGLPLRHYYRTQNHILAKYRHFLQKIGKLLNIEDLDSVIYIEQMVEPLLSSDGEIRDISYSYNPMSFEVLSKKYGRIDWKSLFMGWGMRDETIQETTFICTNPKYFSLLNKMCTSKNLDVWRVWLRTLLLMSFVEYLPPPFDDLHFELFGRALKGNSEKLPQKYLTLKVLQSFAAQDLSRIYVERCVPEGTKELATTMVKRLKTATIQRLNALSWMSEETRALCVLKVKKMLFQIAYPSRWYSETANTLIHPMRPLMNIINLNVTDTTKMLSKLGKACGRADNEWDDGAFVVNAYYYAESNRMTIPAGMLSAPFFDLGRSVGWNYGGIGAAIAHEITHGFDDEGLKYDADGNYQDNWNSHNAQVYGRMTRAVVELFEGQEYMGGRVSGELTLSENLADLGGVAIALTALNNELKGKTESDIRRAWRDFFTSYAVSWRTKERVKKAKEALLTDVHAPPPLRVNLIVRNFAEFFDAFGIQEGDSGWVPEKDRVVFW